MNHISYIMHIFWQSAINISLFFTCDLSLPSKTYHFWNIKIKKHTVSRKFLKKKTLLENFILKVSTFGFPFLCHKRSFWPSDRQKSLTIHRQLFYEWNEIQHSVMVGYPFISRAWITHCIKIHSLDWGVNSGNEKRRALQNIHHFLQLEYLNQKST